jgi:hypothetical protein
MMPDPILGAGIIPLRLVMLKRRSLGAGAAMMFAQLLGTCLNLVQRTVLTG